MEEPFDRMTATHAALRAVLAACPTAAEMALHAVAARRTARTLSGQPMPTVAQDLGLAGAVREWHEDLAALAELLGSAAGPACDQSAPAPQPHRNGTARSGAATKQAPPPPDAQAAPQAAPRDEYRLACIAHVPGLRAVFAGEMPGLGHAFSLPAPLIGLATVLRRCPRAGRSECVGMGVPVTLYLSPGGRLRVAEEMGARFLGVVPEHLAPEAARHPAHG